MIQLGGGPKIERRFNQGDQVLGIAGLYPENYIKARIFGIGVRQATDHDHRDFLVESPQLANEFHTIHVRHQVVSDNHADFCPSRLTAQQGERTLPLGSYMAFNLGFAQHQLTYGELSNIVIQQKGLFHQGYALLSLRYFANTSDSARAQSSSWKPSWRPRCSKSS